ncbi:hypothetical protein [Streptomyces olivochromogenes]|uniref:hypothetical protein n=1 Tax=Streptomyces olivochromogenes TaxID=1963 RepID=UPI00131CC3B9|nr:hypothetical protein [Streptomyces olivochromogenes]
MRRIQVSEPLTEWDLRVKERWFCPWCYAWTELGHQLQEVSRPQYQPVDLRWERAQSPELPGDVSHAYDEAHAYEDFGMTLCGIGSDSLVPSPYGMWTPEGQDVCQSCKEAAAAIDQRWPLEMRGAGKRIHPRPPADSGRPPF